MALYDDLGVGYTRTRHPDPRIAARIREALGEVGPVINVGAGAGSYEPTDLPVVAVEPSPVMVDQRPASAAPALRAVAEALPFRPEVFAAGMAILTMHHWSDIALGIAELRRVVDGPIAVLSWDAAVFDRFWMVAEYLPESGSPLDPGLPSPERIAEALGAGRVEVIPVPADCTDGFYAAWWKRPDSYLDPAIRQNISGIARLPHHEVDLALDKLAGDLADGTWGRRHADLLRMDTYDAGYRLIVDE